MKKSKFVILLLVAVITTWIVSSLSNVRTAQNIPGIILSPDRSKSISFYVQPTRTQVVANFHSGFMVGGGNIVSIDVDTAQIKATWLNKNTIEIKYPNISTTNRKENMVKFFSDSIFVNYVLY